MRKKKESVIHAEVEAVVPVAILPDPPKERTYSDDEIQGALSGLQMLLESCSKKMAALVNCREKVTYPALEQLRVEITQIELSISLLLR